MNIVAVQRIETIRIAQIAGIRLEIIRMRRETDVVDGDVLGLNDDEVPSMQPAVSRHSQEIGQVHSSVEDVLPTTSRTAGYESSARWSASHCAARRGLDGRRGPLR